MELYQKIHVMRSTTYVESFMLYEEFLHFAAIL